jgi:ribosomal protein S27AE
MKALSLHTLDSRLRLEQYSTKKKICPECGQTVSDEHIKENATDIKRRLELKKTLQKPKKYLWCHVKN